MPQIFDQAAFGNQIRLHGKLFYRVAYQILRNPALAEEACQQGLCNTWQKRASLNEPGAIRAWLVKAIIHESLQMLRRSKMERRALERMATESPGENANGRGMGGLATAFEQRESVVAGLAILPEPLREVLVLRMMQGISGNEVAELLGISAAEVSRRLHAGMQRLRDFLGESSAGARLGGGGEHAGNQQVKP